MVSSSASAHTVSKKEHEGNGIYTYYISCDNSKVEIITGRPGGDDYRANRTFYSKLDDAIGAVCDSQTTKKEIVNSSKEADVGSICPAVNKDVEEYAEDIRQVGEEQFGKNLLKNNSEKKIIDQLKLIVKLEYSCKRQGYKTAADKDLYLVEHASVFLYGRLLIN